MPFFTPDAATAEIRTATGVLPPEPESPSLGSVAAAAFRQDNTIVSAITDMRNSGAFTPDPDHNPLDIDGFRGSRYERAYLDRFAGSRSEGETRSIMSRIDGEEADNRTLEAGGMSGLALQMVAGILDPTIAMPTGVAVKSGRAGLTFAQAATRTAVAGAAQAAVQEAALQATQETRSLAGSAVSVATATILSGLLGGAAARLLSPAEHSAAVASLDRARGEMDAHAAGLPAPAGASVTDTRTLDLVPTGLNTIVKPLDPMSRLLNSDSVAARRAAVDLAETPLQFTQNAEGIATSSGPSIERLARMGIDQTRVNVTTEMDRLFSEYRFGSADVSVPRLRSQFESWRGRGDGYTTFDDFKRAVSKALTEGDKSDNPFVEQAAQHIRRTVFDPWKQRAIDAGLLPEGVDVRTAESYFSRVYAKDKIAARRPEFVTRVTDWLQADQAKKAATQERLRGLVDDLTRADEAQQPAIRARIERELEGWEGRSAKGPTDQAVARILASDRNLSPAELRDLAHEITQRILGSPDGRLPYEAGMASASRANDARGPLAARVFNIPDATIRDFLEQDVEHVVNSHLRAIVPDVLLAERFGDARMTDTLRKIETDFARLTDAATTEKARTSLNKQREAALRDVAAIRDRIRGTYGSDYFSIMPNASRVAQAVKNYNVVANLGSATVSSLADMAGVVFRHGLMTTFRDGWLPFFQHMAGTGEAWTKARGQLKAMGIANEALLSSRHNAISDIMDSYRPQSRLERTLQWGASKFQLANLLAPWTDWAKTVAGTVAMSEILRATEAVAKGAATRRQITNLAEASIDAALARRIHAQFTTAGGVHDGVRLANTADWLDRGARDALEGAVGREADIAVVTPGQEKALWLSQPVLGTLGQFKSFVAASTQRVLIANLQRRDAQVLQGALFATGMGMLSYKVNSLTGGQPTSERMGDWIKEGISRSGILGWFEEGNALASKMTRGGVDMYRMIGADKPLSRYAGRSVLDQMLGPTAGKIGTIAQLTGAAGAQEWSEADTKAVRRLIAGQNLFWLRGALNQVEAGANGAFGIPMK